MKNYLHTTLFTSCILLLSCIIFSCDIEPENIPISEINNISQPELAFPNQLGTITSIMYEGQQIEVEKINESYILEGDIRIPNQDIGKSTVRPDKLWPKGYVYYSIDNNLPKKGRVINAITHWEIKTDLIFIPRTHQRNYIRFVKGAGCSSYVGKIGGAQKITLANGCSTGSTIHEIGHAIGLWHEQSRKDRNKSIKILFSNIKSGKASNFKTYIQKGFKGDEKGTFDFNSRMLYSSYAFSKNGKPTITKKNGSTYSINRKVLSNGDISGIAKLYAVEYRKR